MLTRTRARAVAAAATAGLAATCPVVTSDRIGRWGATGEELNGPLPGDDEVPEPAGFLDVGDLHPGPGSRYLAVVGPDGWRRASWYSYDLIDNDRIPSAQQIIPEFQALQAADFVPERAEAGWRVSALEEDRLLLLVTHAPIKGVDWVKRRDSSWPFSSRRSAPGTGGWSSVPRR